MKFNLAKAFILFVAVLFGNLTFAAPNPPAPIPPPPPGLPINEGVVILAISSLVYAFYKIKHYKKASSNS